MQEVHRLPPSPNNLLPTTASHRGDPIRSTQLGNELSDKMMNKMPFVGNSTTYYTPQGLVREKKRERRSRSKTVSDRYTTLSKTTSRSDDERNSSPSPELIHVAPPASMIVEDLPALPDSIPTTPLTRTASEAAETPRAAPSAGSVAQYLHPFIEDEPELGQRTPKPEAAQLITAPEEAPAPEAVPLPSPPKEEPAKEESVEKPAEPEPEPEPTIVTVIEETKPEPVESTAAPEVTTSADEQAKASELPQPEPEQPPTATSPPPVSAPVATSVVASEPSLPPPPPQTQHYHPAHGLAAYGYPPSQIAYHGYPNPRDGPHSPVPFPHSPALGPLISYSPVPGFHSYAHVHPMSMVPAAHYANQYPQPSGMEITSAPGMPQRFDRGQVLSPAPTLPALPPPPPPPNARDSDEAIIQQIAALLPDMVRLVNNDRRGEKVARAEMKAEMKALKTQYEKVIEVLRSDKVALERQVAELSHKADQADMFLRENTRLVSEKHAIVQELALLKEERTLLSRSREALLMTHMEHEKAVVDLKKRLESEQRAHEATIKAVQSEVPKQVKAAEDMNARLRSDIAVLTMDRNNRIKDLETTKSDHITKTGQLEAKIKDLEDEVDRNRKSRRDETSSSSSKYAERSASVSAAYGRDVSNARSTQSSSSSTSANGTTRDRDSSRSEGSSISTRRSNPSQAPTSHRASIASQYFQTSGNGRSGISDRVPGGYDYYDSVDAPPKMERVMSSRSMGTNDNGRG